MMDCHFPAIRAHFAPWTSTHGALLLSGGPECLESGSPGTKSKTKSLIMGVMDPSNQNQLYHISKMQKTLKHPGGSEK